MYAIYERRGKKALLRADYVFEDFKDFYNIAENLGVPFHGTYSINIVDDDIKAVQDFISVSDKYRHLDIRIYASSATIDYITMYKPGLPVASMQKDYDIYLELVGEHRLFFEKRAMVTLYNSIDHDRDSMNDALTLLEQEYGRYKEITEPMLSKFFILNKVTYPRTVLIAYLRQDYNRQRLLTKCINDVGKDVALGAMVKNIKLLFEKKVEYLKTGKGEWIIKELNTRNVDLMYRILYLEKHKLNDIEILLDLYERGLSVDDIIQQE